MTRIVKSKAPVLASIASAVATSLVLVLLHTANQPSSGAVPGGGVDRSDANAEWDDAALQILLSTRVCGSPAVDGYAHVDPHCLELSPTNVWWHRAKPKPEDLVVHIERHADYDGLAVAWGIGNKKGSIEECAKACKAHMPSGAGPYGNLPCNAFAWCPAPFCWEPDVHSHREGDCWLKFTEAPTSPEVNMRGNITDDQRKRHPNAPEGLVPWHAGVVLPRGITLTNGTWGPRYYW